MFNELNSKAPPVTHISAQEEERYWELHGDIDMHADDAAVMARYGMCDPLHVPPEAIVAAAVDEAAGRVEDTQAVEAILGPSAPVLHAMQRRSAGN